MRRIPSTIVPHAGDERPDRVHRIARLVAVVSGIAAVLLCGLVPLLPAKQTTATILWPQAPGPDGLISDVTAPLVSGAPRALDVSIPCKAVATLPAAGGLVFSGTMEGDFFALDAVTGKLAWRIQTGGAIWSNPISYLFEGKQYVVVSAGSSLIAFSIDR